MDNIKPKLRKRLQDNLTAYPQQTTIHGVKYLAGTNRSPHERIFWIAIFIVSFGCLGYFVTNLIISWNEFPVMVVDNKYPTYIFRIPFPAVTICPAIKSPYENLDPLMDTNEFLDTDAGKRFVMKSQICRPTYSNGYQKILKTKPLETNWTRTLIKMSPKLNNSIEQCQLSTWHDRGMNIRSNRICQKLFASIITNEGVCFTFNMVAEVLRNKSLHNKYGYYNIKNSSNGWNPETKYSKHAAYPYKAITDPLIFTLVANSSNISPLCNPPNLGYKIILHSPAAYPHTYERFIELDYGMEYTIAVKPKTISTSRNLKSFSPETRKCFYQRERQLKYYTYYNEDNCKLECYTNYTIQMHGGAPFSSPRDENTTIFKLPHSNYHWDLQDDFELLRKYQKAFNLYGSKEMLTSNIITDCNCLPECFTLGYDYEMLTTNSEVHQSLQVTRNNTPSTLRTTLQIEFVEPSFIGKRRVEMYTFGTLLSEFGGLLGLFLGGSVLSLFELLYFLIIRNHCERN